MISKQLGAVVHQLLVSSEPEEMQAIQALLKIIDEQRKLLELANPSWIDSQIPPLSEKGEHYPVAVLAVVDDPRFRVNGEQPFIDIASYWPALKKWTVTHQCMADESVTDYEVRVTKYRYLPVIGD